MSDNKISNESWDGLVANFLKAKDLTDEKGFLVCTSAEVGIDDKDEAFMTIEVQVQGKSVLWSLNKTNRAKLKEVGLVKPKEIIGKKIEYKKVLARNPQTNQEVDALRIVSIQ